MDDFIMSAFGIVPPKDLANSSNVPKDKKLFSFSSPQPISDSKPYFNFFEPSRDRVKESSELAQRAIHRGKEFFQNNGTQITFSSKQEFVQVMLDAYRESLERNGLSPDYALMLVAQDAGESSWGKSVQGYYNMGNITTNGNDYHAVGKNGKKWKDFDSLEDYVDYKIKFLSKKRYNFFNTFGPDANVQRAFQVLANRGYDPNNPNYGKGVAMVYKTVLKYLKK